MTRKTVANSQAGWLFAFGSRRIEGQLVPKMSEKDLMSLSLVFSAWAASSGSTLIASRAGKPAGMATPLRAGM